MLLWDRLGDVDTMMLGHLVTVLLRLLCGNLGRERSAAVEGRADEIFVAD